MSWVSRETGDHMWNSLFTGPQKMCCVLALVDTGAELMLIYNNLVDFYKTTAHMKVDGGH